jgi:hypothetical protein
MKVRVYFNLNKKLLSVQAKINGSWKVVRYCQSVTLINVTFKVSERGRQRVLKNKRKNVHAYICGTFICDDLVKRSKQDEWMDLITYNPYKLERFYDGEKYVDTADKVFIKGRMIYATNAK